MKWIGFFLKFVDVVFSLSDCIYANYYDKLCILNIFYLIGYRDYVSALKQVYEDKEVQDAINNDEDIDGKTKLYDKKNTI